jgi:hypothetical protein
MHGTHTLMNARYHLGRWSSSSRLPRNTSTQWPRAGHRLPLVRCGPLFAALALAHQGDSTAPTGSRRRLHRISTSQSCRSAVRLLPRCAR